MRKGKLTNEELDALILSKIRFTRPEVQVHAKVGFDCAQLDLADDLVVISTDPITACEENIGAIFVSVCTNDVAAAAAQPVALTVTMLIPPHETKEHIQDVFQDIAHNAKRLNVAIIGGHTEITDCVNKIVLCGTAIGRKARTPKKHIEPGDLLFMSKTAGYEGTSILAHDKAHLLADVLDEEALAYARSFVNNLSVIPDGALAAKAGSVFMHDATEGGVLGAAYEVSEALAMGLSVIEQDIPVDTVTQKICRHFKLDPLRLISSGVMLIAIKKEDSMALRQAFAAHHILLSQIGMFRADGKKELIQNGKVRPLAPPDSDEIYRV